MLLVSSQTDFVVTTLIDFFRLPDDMPNYAESMAIKDKTQCVEVLENAVDDSLCDSRFFSYIQLHEFEALLFSNNKGFECYFSDECASKTASIISSYNNPENINSSPEGAPSKRLLAIKPDYNKVLDGNLIALEVGIDAIIEKCPRFAEWMNRIVEKCKD